MAFPIIMTLWGGAASFSKNIVSRQVFEQTYKSRPADVDLLANRLYASVGHSLVLLIILSGEYIENENPID